MNTKYSELVNLLPSGMELSEKNKKNIHRLFPVPSDFKILWASVEAFGGHPSGIVITDKALIIKGSSDGVKAVNKGIKEENKDKSKKERRKQLDSLYQIILWENFDADDFKVVYNEDFYSIEYASTSFPNFSHDCLAKDFFEQAIKINTVRKREHSAAIAAAQLDILGFDHIIFAAKYGADTTNTGHGIYAEEASAILDKLNRERIQVVGRDNAKDGADKIVDGNAVQCKYHKSASSSVDSCFRTNADGIKEFRYYDLSGKPMMVEVPKDQYDKAINIMKKRIIEGKVNGVTDPNEAYNIIRKGKLTAAQARNLAKAGTIESLTYDVATGAVGCTFAFGLSALTTFAFSFYASKDPKESAKEAAKAGLQTFGLSLATQVLSAQIARTGMQKSIIPLSEIIVNKLGYKITQNLINAIRNLAGKNPIYGAAAAKSLAKAMRTNVITQGIAFVVFAVPDTVKIVRKKMSGAEYAKNVASLFASFVGAGAGGLGASALINKVAKNIPNPVAKTIVFVVGAGVGIAAGGGVRKVIEIFREDDAVIMNRIFESAIMNVCIEYMFDESEMDKFFDYLFKDNEISKNMKNAMKRLYESKEQYTLLRAVMHKAAEKVASERQVLKKADEPNEDDFIEALTAIIEKSKLEEVTK